MTNFLLFLIPDHWLPLVIMGVGFALMLGFVSGRTAFGLIISILAICIFTPFIESFIDSLDVWVLILITVMTVLYVLRMVMTLLLGEHGGGAFMGHLAYDSFLLVLRGAIFFLLTLPIRLLGGIFRFMRQRVI